MALRVLKGDSLTRNVARARVPSLAAQPFRPGELAMPVRIELSAMSAERVLEQAGREGLPAELWTRVAVEGARQLERAAKLARVQVRALGTELDELAASRPAWTISTTARGLRGYARLLRAAGATRLEAPARRRLTLLLPDQLAAAWAGSAAAAGMVLSAWASEMIRAAPTTVISWEAAAAEAGDSLGEWVLTAALERRP